MWYLLNIYFNIYNKEVLKATATPFTNTALQFGVGALVCLFMWGTRLHKAPKVSRDSSASVTFRSPLNVPIAQVESSII